MIEGRRKLISMPATISMEEGMVLKALSELLRQPEGYACRFDLPPAEDDRAGARQLVADALAIIDDLEAKQTRFPRS